MGDIVKYYGREICKDKNGKIVRAITRNQDYLLDVMDKNDIIFVSGHAGTGKTSLATWYAIAGMDEGKYDHLVLTRPIVEAGESLGFLPGTFEEKVAPFMQPLYDCIEQIKGKKITAEFANKINAQQAPVSKYKAKRGKSNPEKKKLESNEDFYKKVEVCPLAYLRGATKKNSFIVLDESQNVTRKQMLLMLSRIGTGSKILVAGDLDQSDLPRKSDSGFAHAIKLLKGIPRIAHVEFTADDIVRSSIAKAVILRYASENRKSHDRGDVYEHRPEEYDFAEDDLPDDGYYPDDEVGDEDSVNPTDNTNDK